MKDRQRLVVEVERTLFFAQPVISQADIIERGCLAAAVADGAHDGERLVVAVERALLFAKRIVDRAEVVERHGFRASVACGPEQRQRLREIFDDLLFLAKRVINGPDVIERHGFAAAVANNAHDGERLVVAVERALLFAEPVIDQPDVVERHSRAGLVPCQALPAQARFKLFKRGAQRTGGPFGQQPPAIIKIFLGGSAVHILRCCLGRAGKTRRAGRKDQPREKKGTEPQRRLAGRRALQSWRSCEGDQWGVGRAEHTMPHGSLPGAVKVSRRRVAYYLRWPDSNATSAASAPGGAK